jgi:hypothetical protein
MNVESQGSSKTDAPAVTDAPKKDVINTPPQDSATAEPPAKASGEEQPSAPVKADPPAPAASTDKPGVKTAQENPEKSIQQAIEDHPVLKRLAGKTDSSDPKKSKAPEQPKADQKAKEPAATSTDNDEPPSDPKERNRVFAEMRVQARTQAKEIEGLKAHAEFGKEMADVFTSEGVFDDFKQVDDDQLAGVVRIQAALNRVEHVASKGGKPSEADIAVLNKAIESLEGIAGKAGISRSAVPEPITGALPDRWADMVDSGMVSEDEARLFAAVEKAKSGKVEKTPAKAEPTATEQPAKSERRVPEQQQQRAPEVSADEHVARNLTREHLVEQGIPAPQVSKHYRENLLPIILGDLVRPVPGKDQAQTFLAMTPMAQHVVVEKAHARWQQKQAALKRPAGDSEGRAGETPTAPMMRRRFGRGLPTQLADGSPEGEAKAKLAYLAGKT